MSAVAQTAPSTGRPPIARGWPRRRSHRLCAGRLVDRYRHRPRRLLVLAWNPELFAKYAPAYLAGLGVTLALVVDLDRARRDPVGPDRLCAHVAKPDPVRPRLRLCLFLPRHAAARPDLPDLLRARLVPAAARGGRPVGFLPRSLVLRDLRLLAQHRRLSGRDPARRDRKRAARANGKAPPRSACTSCRRCGRSSCRRR